MKPKGFLVIAGLALICVGVAKGFIPGPPIPTGTVVYDPTVAADAVTSITNLITISNLITYGQGFFHGGWKYQWQGIVYQLIRQNTPNHFGETNGWHNAIGAGVNAPGAWYIASMPYAPGPSAIMDTRQMAQLATVDVHDAAGINALQAVGQSNSDRKEVDAALGQWEKTVLDETTGTNSEVQQLNLITGGAALNLHYAQLTDNKISAMVELEIAAAKQRRDEGASSIQYAADVDALSGVQGFGMGTCVSCTLRPMIP